MYTNSVVFDTDSSDQLLWLRVQTGVIKMTGLSFLDLMFTEALAQKARRDKRWYYSWTISTLFLPKFTLRVCNDTWCNGGLVEASVQSMSQWDTLCSAFHSHTHTSVELWTTSQLGTWQGSLLPSLLPFHFSPSLPSSIPPSFPSSFPPSLPSFLLLSFSPSLPPFSWRLVKCTIWRKHVFTGQRGCWGEKGLIYKQWHPTLPG